MAERAGVAATRADGYSGKAQSAYNSVYGDGGGIYSRPIRKE